MVDNPKTKRIDVDDEERDRKPGGHPRDYDESGNEGEPTGGPGSGEGETPSRGETPDPRRGETPDPKNPKGGPG